MNNVSLIQIDGTVYSHSWGMDSKASIIGKMVTESEYLTNVCSELCFGTYGCSNHHQVPLSMIMDKQLPYRLKIVSVQSATPVQMRPDKKLTERMVREFPSLCKDTRYSPVMIVALTPFCLLEGFKSSNDIYIHTQECPEFYLVFDDLTREKLLNGDKKAAYSYYLENENTKLVTLFHARLRDKNRTHIEDVILRTLEKHPGDWTVFHFYFLHLHNINPGTAFGIDFKRPYCYLSGQAIECNLASENTLSIGFTNGEKNVKLFCENVKYVTLTRDSVWEGLVQDKETVLYKDLQMFVETIVTRATYPLRPVDGSSILLFISGIGVIKSEGSEGVTVKPGSAFYLKEGEAFWMSPLNKGGEIMCCRCYA